MAAAGMSGGKIAALALLVMAISVSAVLISDSSDDSSAAPFDIVEKNILYLITPTGDLEVVGLQDTTVSSVFIPDSITHTDSGGGSVAKTYYVTSIADGAFNNEGGLYDNLRSVRLSENLTYIGEYAFYRSNLVSVSIPASIETIGEYAFAESGIQSVSILGSLTSIPAHMFESCTSLTSVSLPDTMSSIGECTFSGCTALNDFKMPSGIIKIDDSAFKGCRSLTQVDLPDSLSVVGAGVFEGCISIGEVIIPDMASVPESMFRECSSLTKVVLSPLTSSIGNMAFSGCSNLFDINLKNTVTTIGDESFNGCSSLEDLELTTSIVAVGSNAFAGCTGLRYVTIPTTITSAGDAMFGDIKFFDKTRTEIKDQNLLLGHSFEKFNIGMTMVNGCNYTISYDVNGASQDLPDKKVNCGSSFIITEYEGERPGFVFIGWSCEGKDYLIGQTFTMPGYSVHFDSIWDVYVEPDDDKGIINEETIKFILWAVASVLFGIIILGFSLYIIYRRRH